MCAVCLPHVRYSALCSLHLLSPHCPVKDGEVNSRAARVTQVRHGRANIKVCLCIIPALDVGPHAPLQKEDVRLYSGALKRACGFLPWCYAKLGSMRH